MAKKLFYILVLLLPVQLILAQSKNDSAIAVIKASREASNAAILKHDIEGLAKYWLNNFVQVRGNATYLAGKDSIIASWKQLFESNPEVGYIRTPAEVVISVNDTLAWETGTWKAIKSYSKGGKYSAMWRKSDGSWKIQAELFVSLY